MVKILCMTHFSVAMFTEAPRSFLQSWDLHLSTDSTLCWFHTELPAHRVCCLYHTHARTSHKIFLISITSHVIGGARQASRLRPIMCEVMVTAHTAVSTSVTDVWFGVCNSPRRADGCTIPRLRRQYGVSEAHCRRYEPEQRLTSPHNKAVTSDLLGAISASPDLLLRMTTLFLPVRRVMSRYAGVSDTNNLNSHRRRKMRKV